MASLKYQDIFSRFFSLAEAYDLVDLDENMSEEFLRSWLHSAVADPFVHRQFSSVTLDEELGSMDFELKSPSDDAMGVDDDFVLELVGYGMVLAWLRPKINSTLNVLQVYGSKEEKYYSQQSHLSGLINLQKQLQKTQRMLVADRNVSINTYLLGDENAV